MKENKLELHIEVSIRGQGRMYGDLRLSETFEIGDKDFLEMCKILGQFNELAKKCKA